VALRILIADDHGVLRAGLRALLSTEPGLEVVAEASDGDEALRLAEALRPDIVLADVSMPGASGIEVARQLTARRLGIRVLILTMHEDESLLHEALRAGAVGYIPKRAVEDELVSAIRAVARGGMYVHPAMTRALLASTQHAPLPDPLILEPLTPRETEILGLIAQGHTNRQIAERLSLSVRTVESHRSNLMTKLQVHSRVELVRYATSHGLLDPNAK
jgi:two-component system, NarL family, response regulator NreC